MKSVIPFVAFVLMLISFESIAQSDSLNYDYLILKNDKKNRAFIICKGESIDVQTTSNISIAGKLDSVTSFHLVIDGKMIPFNQINEITYKSEVLKNIKKMALNVGSLALLANSLASYAFLLYDMLDLDPFFEVIASSLFKEIVFSSSLIFFTAGEVLLISYPSFNLKKHWYIPLSLNQNIK